VALEAIGLNACCNSLDHLGMHLQQDGKLMRLFDVHASAGNNLQGALSIYRANKLLLVDAHQARAHNQLRPHCCCACCTQELRSPTAAGADGP
jgi:hypothetical protein